MTTTPTSPEPMCAALRNSKGWPTLGNAAADMIEALAARLAEVGAELRVTRVGLELEVFNRTQERGTARAQLAVAYEVAAKWHDDRIAQCKERIAENEIYLAKSGEKEGHIQYCRDSIFNSRLAGQAIRALTPADATAALTAMLDRARGKAWDRGISDAKSAQVFTSGMGMNGQPSRWYEAIAAMPNPYTPATRAAAKGGA